MDKMRADIAARNAKKGGKAVVPKPVIKEADSMD